MLPAPWLLALALGIALLVLIPAQRLRLAGFSARTIGLYALALWLLAMLLAVRPVGARVLVPILLVAYLAPFVAGPDRIRRAADRGRSWVGPDGGRTRDDGRRPMKNVTPSAGEGSGDTDRRDDDGDDDGQDGA